MTKLKEQLAAAETPAAPLKEIFAGKVPLDRIEPATNARKYYDPAYIKELAGSIGAIGDVIEPVVLRPNGKAGHYFLVAGYCRVKAAKDAGLKELSARVFDVDEQGGLELQMIENLQRRELNPIEEARGLDQLFKTGKYTAASLAEKLKKSETHIHRAVKLLALPAEIIEAIEKGQLTAAHGHQILRVPKDRVKEAAGLALESVYSDDCGDNRYLRTAAQLRDVVDRIIGLELAKVEFPKDKPYAGENACAVCPRNSANQGVLFDGAGDRKPRCMDNPCFEKKTKQVWEDLKAEGAKKWPQLEYAGFGTQSASWPRSIDGLPGLAIIHEDEHKHPVVKKLLEEKPHKMGYAVAKPHEHYYSDGKWKKSKLLLVCNDPTLIGGARTEKIVDGTKAAKAKGTAGTKTQKTQRSEAEAAKDAFFEEAEKKAVLDAIAKAMPKFKVSADQFALVLRNEISNCYGDALEFIEQMLTPLNADSDADELAAIPLAKQLQLAVLASIAEDEGLDEVASVLGLDLSKLKAAAAKDAKKAWDEKQAAGKKDKAGK